jgi:4'-phosphopantetheinyl transferase
MAEPEARWVLGADDVHVWRVVLDRPQSAVRRLARFLSPDEQRRAERFRLDLVRTRFVVCRGALRLILGRYTGRAPARLRLTYGKHGKPALDPSDNPPGLCFNVSHSGGLALFAVARGREVGVDVERLRALPRAERIAERFFSAPETTALKAVPAERRIEAFFTCWTRKEAYIKARGDGLAHPLNQFAVTLAPGEPARLRAAGDGDEREIAQWSLGGLLPAPGYVAALAVRGDGWRLTSRPWPLHG